MELKRITKQVRLTHWSEIIREKNTSGKNVRKYCAENGINEKTYYYWQRKLRESACEIFESLSESEELPHPPSMFTEVVVSPSKETLQSKEATCGLLRIEICGMCLTADSHYPVETLSELLKGLLRS